MSELSDLVRKVIHGKVTPSQVIEAVRAMAPESAAWDQSHSWWPVFGDEILETLIRVSKDKVYLNVQEAVRVATQRRGRVLGERIAGVQVYRVLAVEDAVEVVVERLVEAAVPADWVEPIWDFLPTLDVVRREVDRIYLRRLLTKNAWNLSAAAREAGVARQSLYKLVELHRLTRPCSSTETGPDTEVEQAA